MDGNPLFVLDGAAGGREGGGESVLNTLLTRGAETESGSAGRLGGAEKLARRSEGNGRGADAQVAGTAQGAGTTSCSATDWPVELLLDGGPGGSDAVGALARDRRLAGSESGSDTEPSVSVCGCLCTSPFTLWVIICRSMLARSREIWKLARSRETREWRR